MKNLELRPEELAVLAAARDALDPSAIQRARVRRGLDAKIVAGVAAPLLVTSTALATMLKVGASIVVVAAVGTGIVFVAAPHWLPRSGSHAASPPARTAGAPTARPMASPPLEPPTAAAQPAAEASPAADLRLAPAHPRVSAHRHDTSPIAPVDLAGELALLTQVNAATRQGDVVRADALLRDYDQRFSGGQLAQERAAAGILVNCAAGRVQAARVEARRFLERWPRSPLVARIGSSCAAEEQPP